MKTDYIVLLKKIFLVILFLFLTTKLALSDVINKFEVTGNDRLAKETIILFSELNINDNINSNDLKNDDNTDVDPFALLDQMEQEESYSHLIDEN